MKTKKFDLDNLKVWQLISFGASSLIPIVYITQFFIAIFLQCWTWIASFGTPWFFNFLLALSFYGTPIAALAIAVNVGVAIGTISLSLYVFEIVTSFLNKDK